MIALSLGRLNFEIGGGVAALSWAGGKHSRPWTFGVQTHDELGFNPGWFWFVEHAYYLAGDGETIVVAVEMGEHTLHGLRGGEELDLMGFEEDA